MNKKEFYKKINGKKVVIENIEQIRKDIKANYKDYKEQVKNYNLYMKTAGNKDITIKFNKEYGAGYQIGSQFIRTPLIQLILVHSIETKTVVRSNDVIINNCYFNKKDIVILSDNTFTSVNKIANYDIIFKIVD